MHLIVTNNPRVCGYVAAKKLAHQIRWVDGHTEDVLTTVRDLCHLNHRLVTHPLTGSVKPNLTPYKTVVLEALASDITDHESVLLAETCLRKTQDLLAGKPRPDAVCRYLDDFACIDFDFFKSYLISTATI